jgi:hypothetical protein
VNGSVSTALKGRGIVPDAPVSSASRKQTRLSSLRPTGSISLGWDLVAGSSRVPSPATGTTAMLRSGMPKDKLEIRNWKSASQNAEKLKG